MGQVAESTKELEQDRVHGGEGKEPKCERRVLNELFWNGYCVGWSGKSDFQSGDRGLLPLYS